MNKARTRVFGCAGLLGLAFLLPCPAASAPAEPYRHTITIDGVCDFTSGEVFGTTSSSRTAMTTWDGNRIYFGCLGPEIGPQPGGSQTYLVIYLDCGSGSSGAPFGLLINTQSPGMPAGFAPDYAVVARSDGATPLMWKWDGAQWTNASSIFTHSAAAGYLEMSLPFSYLGGRPEDLRTVFSLVCEAAGAEWTYAGAPSNVFVDGYDPDFISYLSSNLLSSLPPNQQGGGAEIGWCNLQWPSMLTTTTGAASEPVFGQVWIDGVTNRLGATVGLTAELGYGPDGSDPSVAPTTWQWTPAAFNLDVDNNDEFVATLTVATPGGYDYCYRSSYLGGAWLYADLDGTDNGYSPATAGALTVTSGSAVEEELPAQLSFALQGGNPVVGSARFRFGLPQRMRVELSIHDVTGRRLATLAAGEFDAGYDTVDWESVGATRAGVYFARFHADGRSFTRRLVVLR
jgi:hypothetical protein